MLATSSKPIPPLCHRADPRDPLSRDRSWWLCHCRGLHERQVADRLVWADVPVLLLLVHVVGVAKGRRYSHDGPLFPNYLFVSGDEFDLLNARTAAAGRIRYVIPVSEADRPTLMDDLANLLNAIDAGAPLGKARPAVSGDRVRVVCGPYEGTEGTLVREAGRDELLLHVHALGQVVPLTIEKWRCEVLDP